MKWYSGQNYVIKCNTIFLQNNIDVEIIAIVVGWFSFSHYKNRQRSGHKCQILKSLKVFRLKAAILSLQFVNLVMFYCSLLSKTCLNVYRPISPILFLLGTSCNLMSSVPVVPQRSPPGLPQSPLHYKIRQSQINFLFLFSQFKSVQNNRQAWKGSIFKF